MFSHLFCTAVSYEVFANCYFFRTNIFVLSIYYKVSFSCVLFCSPFVCSILFIFVFQQEIVCNVHNVSQITPHFSYAWSRKLFAKRIIFIIFVKGYIFSEPYRRGKPLGIFFCLKFNFDKL